MATGYNLAFLIISIAILVSIHISSGINIFESRGKIGEQGLKIEKEETKADPAADDDSKLL